MDPSNWLFVPLIELMIVTLVLLVVLGGTVVFPPNWGHDLQQAALDEVHRRFAGLGTRSQADFIAAARMIGAKRELSDSSDDTANIILTTVIVLTNASDPERIRKQLNGLRTRLQSTALRRQVALVSKVASIRIASYLWVACDWVHRCFFALVGLIWLLPRSCPFLAARLQRNSGVLGLIGIIAGIFWAALMRGATTPEGAAFDWLGLVGDVALIFTIGGIVVAVLGLYKTVLVSLVGAPRQWTRRGLVAGVSFVLCAVITIGVGLSGLLTQWQRNLAAWTQKIEMTDDAARWLGGAMVAATIIYLAWNGYQWVRRPGIWLSDRLWIIAASQPLLVMLVVVILFAADLPPSDFGWLSTSAACAMIILGCIATGTAGFEWIQKYRALRKLGRRVPRKGFRWWALITWVTLAFALGVTPPPLMTVDLRAMDPTLVIPLTVLLNVAAIVWMLAFFPGAIVTVLYVRRVSKAYETFRFSLAPEHPLLSGTGVRHSP
ncbi:hypothetical protein [Rathayibacter toxicus]|uniref:hypothetical protein n=1 Tax=Rathayibacter toxicus TaxID=145458 RepID=UPI000CE73EE0|nr:hypothetical protein [Rathayibacter toxicus]PPI53164.1 hypothetical protein C5D35_09525 [Rathayibacter toxicus]QOD10767.1 hypothetical protein BSG36_01940 [Rathayibacter toxicus]QWL27507.1 hypothetical protein E2R33_01945 [Rathayibacter toxicus]QWL31719.1 hypothetical protein E2R35_01905 [Rathayibacter toxicus]QWL33813.1 hypothetical protein E2R36_01905 [Rathayibacter toxicus]